jgi:hypothetical protein
MAQRVGQHVKERENFSIWRNEFVIIQRRWSIMTAAPSRFPQYRPLHRSAGPAFSYRCTAEIITVATSVFSLETQWMHHSQCEVTGQYGCERSYCRILGYCSVWCRCWVVTSKQTTKQHLLLGNRFLISKYTRTLLGGAFADRHVPMKMIGGNNGWTVFSTWSVPRI